MNCAGCRNLLKLTPIPKRFNITAF
ncbi:MULTISPECIES: zinc finger domain-containing protein [Clostridia]